ncbi:hypothetical protein EDC94DRAFT_694169 [Helicostylum pulchrum]|nr:hypothetical protein EDC94DRAFT_694169 [Helicostylum pulchrum]
MSTSSYIEGDTQSKAIKLALGAKACLNEIIKVGSYLNEDDIKNIKVPYLQIMGFKAVLSVLKLKDNGLYVAEDTLKFQFPTTKKQFLAAKKQLRNGCIVGLVKGLFPDQEQLNNSAGEEVEEELVFNTMQIGAVRTIASFFIAFRCISRTTVRV